MTASREGFTPRGAAMAIRLLFMVIAAVMGGLAAGFLIRAAFQAIAPPVTPYTCHADPAAHAARPGLQPPAEEATAAWRCWQMTEGP